MSDLIYPEESYEIVGACFEVYKEKGCGFLEAVFQECLELEFGESDPIRDAPAQLALANTKGVPLKQIHA
jgi:GxxExxY protein